MLPEKLPKLRKTFFISVSKAASFLGISADTLRNWETQGRLVPQRTQGGARRYALADLKRIKAEISPKKAYKGTFLPISKASQFLGISPDTLRNWEKSGRIESERTPGGARRYSRSFLNRVKSDLEIKSPVPPTQTQERNWLKVIQTSLLLIFLVLAFFLGSNLFVSDQELGDSSQVGKLEKRLYEVAASLEKLQKSLYNLQGNLDREGSPSGRITNISKDVLALTSGSDYLEFNTDVSLNGLLSVNGSGVFSEELLAPNIIYGVVGGDGISVTEGQNPTISSAETLATVTGRGATTTTLVTLTGGATLGASLNLGNLSSDPSSPSNGALYYSTSSNKLRCYINGSWKDCDTDTTGDGDITAVNTGNGLSGGSSSGSVTIELDVTTTSTSTTTSANSGLEVASSGLSLLRGCSDSQALVWSSSSAVWTCTTSGGGDITAVGSMTSGAAFADSTADDDWLGLGASAGRIEFDDQSTDEVNILSANVGIGDSTPSSLLEVGDGTDSLQVSSVGDITFVDANGAASITGPAGGALSVLAGASQALTLTANGTSTWSTTAGGLTIQANANAINLTLAGGDNLPTAVADGNDVELTAEDDILFTATDDITATLAAAGEVIIDAATTDSTLAYSSADALNGVLELKVDTATNNNVGFGLNYDIRNTASITAYAQLINLDIDNNASFDSTAYGLYVNVDKNDTGSVAVGVKVSGTEIIGAGTGDVYTGSFVDGRFEILTTSVTTSDVFTLEGLGLTTGSLAVLTGKTIGAGATDAVLKITSDIGNIGTSNGMISSTATFDTSSATGVNLYLSSSDAVASGNTDYGMYNTVTNSGATSSNKTVYGQYTTVSNTGATGGTQTTYAGYFIAAGDIGGTSSVYGLFVDANASDTSYGIYIDDGAGTTDYGLYQSATTDDNYFAGQVGIGDTTPDNILDVNSTTTSGNILTVGADSAVTVSGASTALTGVAIDLTTNYTTDDDDVKAIDITLDATTDGNATVDDLIGIEISGGAVTVNGTSAAPVWRGLDITLPAGTTTSGTSYTADAVRVSTPTDTQTTALTTTYNGFNITSAGALTQSTAAGTMNWRGANITMPNITQTTGTVTASGVLITPGTITTGGTQNGLAVVANTTITTAGTQNLINLTAPDGTPGSGTLNGLNIGAPSINSSATDNAINIATNWDMAILLGDDSLVGFGTSAGRIEFDDQTTDEVNILSANVGIGDSTPSSLLEVGDGTDSIQFSSVGDITFVDANGAASITGPAGGDLTLTSPVSLTLTTSAANGDISLTPNGTGSVLVTSTVTSGTGTSAGVSLAANSLTTGYAMSISSTSTAGTVSLTDVLLDVRRSGTNSNSGHSTYGISIDMSNTGTTSTNYGIYSQAYGAATTYGVYASTNSAASGTQYGLYSAPTSASSGTAYALYADAGTGAGTEYAGIFVNGNVGIGDTTPDALLDLDSTATTGGDFLITNTGIGLSGTVAGITSNSTTTGDILTLSATALTTGSALVLTGPSGGTAGVTDAAIKLSSDVGNIGTSNGLISSTATIDSTATGISGVNLYLNTASAQALATTVSQDYYGVYQTLAKTGADTTSGTINSYGIYSTVSNTGGDTAATRNTYGGYFTATGDASGTTTAYGVYASAASADNNHPFYMGVAPSAPASTTAALCWDGAGESGILDCTGAPVQDYAEIYPTEGGVDYGEIVVTGNNLVETKRVDLNKSSIVSNEETVYVAALIQSSQPYQSTIIGITSNNYGDFTSTGHGSVKDSDHPIPVALSGRVPVKISKNSEAIFRGDYITSSGESGKAMKASRAGVMIGKALEDWDPNSGKNRIMVFVGVNYADPNNFLASLSFDEEGSLITPKLIADNIQVSGDVHLEGALKVGDTTIDSSTLLAVGNLVNDVNLIKDTTTKLASEINDVKVRVGSAELRVKSVEEKQATDSAQLAEAKKLGEDAVAQTISLQDRVASTSANLASLSTKIDELLSSFGISNQIATSSTTPRNDVIASDSEAISNLTSPEVLFASDSAKLANLDVSEKISTLNLESSGILKSLGETLLGKTIIAGDLSVDGTFSISDNSINALPILKLQNSSLATLVDFFNGLVTINKEGTLVAKNLEAESIKVAAIKVVAGSTSGEGILKANQKSVEIENLAVTPSSRIIITPTTNTNLVLAVTNKTKGEKFTVSTPQISTQDIKFDWLLINEE